MIERKIKQLGAEMFSAEKKIFNPMLELSKYHLSSAENDLKGVLNKLQKADKSISDDSLLELKGIVNDLSGPALIDRSDKELSGDFLNLKGRIREHRMQFQLEAAFDYYISTRNYDMALRLSPAEVMNKDIEEIRSIYDEIGSNVGKISKQDRANYIAPFALSISFLEIFMNGHALISVDHQKNIEGLLKKMGPLERFTSTQWGNELEEGLDILNPVEQSSYMHGRKKKNVFNKESDKRHREINRVITAADGILRILSNYINNY